MTTRASQIREIEAIVADNARLLGETPRLAVRFTPKRGWPGWVRIYDLLPSGKVNRKAYREYLGFDKAIEAAHEANARAKRWRELVDGGMAKDDAYRAVVPASER